MTMKYSFIFLLLCGLGLRGILAQVTEVNNEQVCIGTGNGMSSPSLMGDDNYLYQSMKERFEGCTYVEGNLEVKFLRDNDMSFLKDIKEVTGYVLILMVWPKIISFPELRVIRGTELYEGNVALYVAITYPNRLNDTGLRELQFPKLHEIIKGDVRFEDNRDLCYVRTIDWSDMREGLEPFYSDHGTSCTTGHVCAPNCPGGCWGRGPDMCQELTRKNCSRTCDYRCKGPMQADCCHRSCASGCTGPTNQDCLACLRLTMDDQCVEACPPRTMYNAETFQNEPNPDFRYAYGPRCLTSCPDNLLEEGDNCINQCPRGTIESTEPGEKKCVGCDGTCPKVCEGTIGELFAKHFNNGALTNCTIIKNNIFIGTSSFEGDPFLGEQGITLEMLERLSTVQEVKGYVTVQGRHPHFTDLTFLRNLKKIFGRQLYGKHALSVLDSSVQSLNLVSLQSIEFGNVFIKYNSRLCNVKKEMFRGIVAPEAEIIVAENGDSNNNYCDCHAQCENGCFGPGEGKCCHEQCHDGCTDSTDAGCQECRNVNLNGRCKDNCGRAFIYNTATFALEPNPEFRFQHGHECVEKCPKFAFTEGLRCVERCSQGHREEGNQCIRCGGACPQQGEINYLLVNDQCDGVKQYQWGVINRKNSPTGNVTCTQVLIGPPGSTLKLKLLDVDIHSSIDEKLVLSAAGYRESFDRNAYATTLHLKTNVLIVQHRTVAAGNGYILAYNFMAPEGDVADQGCDQVLTENTGSFMSPDYPEKYRARERCTYHIVVDPGYLAEVVFQKLNLQGDEPSCTADKIEVIEPILGTSKTYCGRHRPPFTISSKTNYLVIKFTSDDSGNFKGFSADFRAVKVSEGGEDFSVDTGEDLPPTF